MDWNKTDDGGVKLEDGWIVETEEITTAQRGETKQGRIGTWDTDKRYRQNNTSRVCLLSFG